MGSPVIDVREQIAAILWYRAGAVVKWENAGAEVRNRYRAKADAALAAVDALGGPDGS